MGKSGTASLPLHNGSAPRWLFDRMEQLGGAIAEVIIDEYGHDELLERLADPYWFQAFGCVLGFDWHSSGLTTTTMGALQEALDAEEHGIMVAGGKGKQSRKALDHITQAPFNLSTGTRETLQNASRMSASIDNSCVQDSYTLYHHTFVLTERGDWCVIQQGMNDSYARRYHWLCDTVDSYVNDPQNAVCSQQAADETLNLAATQSDDTRSVSLDLVNDNPAHLKRYLRPQHQSSLHDFTGQNNKQPALEMPTHHWLQDSDLTERTLTQLQQAYEFQPDEYEELVSIRGIGKKSLRALAMVAEIIHGTDSSWEDPAKYSYAHGGKDGTPYPVDRERYDESIAHVRTTLNKAETERKEKQNALKRLNELTQ